MMVRGNKGYILLYCQINLLEEISLSAGQTDRKKCNISAPTALNYFILSKSGLKTTELFYNSL